MVSKLSLYIPEPAALLAMPATFEGLCILEVGMVRRPEPSAAEQNMRDLPYQLIRVLDNQGVAKGHGT